MYNKIATKLSFASKAHNLELVLIFNEDAECLYDYKNGIVYNKKIMNNNNFYVCIEGKTAYLQNKSSELEALCVKHNDYITAHKTTTQREGGAQPRKSKITKATKTAVMKLVDIAIFIDEAKTTQAVHEDDKLAVELINKLSSIVSIAEAQKLLDMQNARIKEEDEKAQAWLREQEEKKQLEKARKAREQAQKAIDNAIKALIKTGMTEEQARAILNA